MLGWIEKVVPQPPVISSMPVVVEKDDKQDPKANEAKSGNAQQKSSEGNPSHPAGGSEKKEGVVTPDPVSTTESSGQGVLTWLSQGLGKVMPHPLQHASPLQPDSKTSDACNQTEALNVDDKDKQDKTDKDKQETTNPSGGGGEPQPSSDNNAPEKNGTKKAFTRLLEEFEKMMPQPEAVKKTEEVIPEDRTADQGNTKGTNKEIPKKESSPAKTLPKHQSSADNLSVSLLPQTPGGHRSSMFKRFMQGLEKAIPQPVCKEKQDGQTVQAGGQDPGQERSKGA